MISPLFDLKQSVAGLFSKHKEFSKVIADENELFRLEVKIFGNIEKYEENRDLVQMLRYKNRNNILKLQNALSRVDTRDESKLSESFDMEKKSITEWRSYEKNVRNQVYDIKMIIELLRDIINDERKETMVDMMTPFAVLNEYFGRLHKIIRKQSLDKKVFSELSSLIEDMNKSYHELIGIAEKYIDTESKFFDKNKSLTDYFRERGRLKQQLNGKTQALLQQIQLYEESLVEALKKTKNTLDDKFTNDLLQNLAFFRKHFIGKRENLSISTSNTLIQFCADRIQISNRIIHDAAQMQNEKLVELDSLKNELDTLYKKFVEQENIKKTQSAYHNKLAEKRISEFDEYRKGLEEVDKFIKSLSKETNRLDNFIIKVEKKDMELLNKESDVRELKRNISRWDKRFAASAAILVGMPLFQTQMGEGADTMKSAGDIQNIAHRIALKTELPKITDTALQSVLDALPETFFSMDSTSRKKLLNLLQQESDNIDSALNKIGVGKRDNLKRVALGNICAKSQIALNFQNDTLMTGRLMERVKKAMEADVPGSTNKSYMRAQMPKLINKYAPMMLPKDVPIDFIAAIWKAESGGDMFAVSDKDARGWYQIIRGTWGDFTTLPYDVFVWDPEISLIIALKYIRYLHTVIPRDAYRATDWSRYEYEITPALGMLCEISAAYNCGPGGLENAGYNIARTPGQTRKYVPIILGNMLIPKKTS
ncbi:MAG: transglycosylase SLT domain-containing protein [Candidatus Woesearchaeota archaeon]